MVSYERTTRAVRSDSHLAEPPPLLHQDPDETHPWMLGWVTDTTRSFLGRKTEGSTRASMNAGTSPILWGLGGMELDSWPLPVSLHPPQLSREAWRGWGLVEEGIRTLGPGHGAMKQTRQM